MPERGFSGQGPWHDAYFDSGDYRYLAEHFFGVPHDLSTYAEDFREMWGKFLDQVAFRDLGVGAYGLALKALDFPVESAFSVSLKFFLVLSYVLFFLFAKRRFGLPLATVALALLALPPTHWLLTEELMSEGFLRIFFVLLLFPALALRRDFRNALPCALGAVLLLLFVAHFKVQWMLLGFLLLPALLVPFLLTRRFRAAALVTLCILAIPASLSFVHYSGWGDARVIQGSGLHAMWKTDGQNLAYACEQGFFKGYEPTFCRTQKYHYGNWGHFVSMQDPAQDLQQLTRDLDRASMQYFLERPHEMLREFLRALFASTSFAGWGEGLGNARLFLDIAGALLLLIGLTRRESFLLSSIALGLWVIPAIGAVFAPFEIRYLRPMAGIPLVAALFVLSRVALLSCLNSIFMVLYHDAKILAAHAISVPRNCIHPLRSALPL